MIQTHRNAQMVVRDTLLLAFLCLSTACTWNATTNRADSALVGEKQELEQGAKAAKEVEEQIGLVKSPALTAYVEKIGERLVAQSKRQNIDYQFRIVDMPEPNAFALPGGYIYVSRGMLAIINSEDELATILGHELGHVTARHSVGRQTANLPMIPVRLVTGISAAAASIVSPTIGSLIGGIGNLPGDLALASYSRSQEREADRLGQKYAASGGWNPAALANCMTSLARDEKFEGGDPNSRGWLASHPASPERARDAAEYAKGLTVSSTAPILNGRSAFFDRISGIVVGDSGKSGVFMKNRFMHPELRFGIEMPAGWTTANASSAVVAQNKAKTGAVVLQLAAEGSDPVAVATETGKKLRFVSPSKRVQVNGLDAVEAVVETGDRASPGRAYVLWIATGGMVYQVAGAAHSEQWESLRSTLRTSARSFHRLDDAEIESVRENRLRVAVAPRQESLTRFLGSGVENKWGGEETAIANGIEEKTVLEAGRAVKVIHAEPYRP